MNMKTRKLRGLLAVLLALVLTLTMMPAVFAENNLQSQIDGAETVTVKLTADTTECIVIPAGKTVTNDANWDPNTLPEDFNYLFRCSGGVV